MAGGLRCIFSFDGTPAREPASERRIVRTVVARLLLCQKITLL